MSKHYAGRTLKSGQTTTLTSLAPRDRGDGTWAIDCNDPAGRVASLILSRSEWDALKVNMFAAASPTPTPVPTTGVKWGGRIGYADLDPSDAPWSTAAIDRFEANAGKKISYLQFGQRFGAFDTTAMNTLKARGIYPHIESVTKLVSGADLTVTQIADGAGDAAFTAFCDKAKAWGSPFNFRFLWEFNGPWLDTYYGTNVSYAYSRPADYVRAWRRLHGIAVARGATNIRWMWCPNMWPAVDDQWAAKDPTPWWPGLEYVDLGGIDGYAGGRTLDKILEKPYPYMIAKLQGKPLYFETGCYESGAGGSHIPPAGWTKAQWITDMFAKLPNYNIQVFNWFNDKEGDRPSEGIETSPEAMAAFRAGIASSRYV